jgi:hypothetical protein
MRVLDSEGRLPVFRKLKVGGSVLLSQEVTENTVNEPGYFVPAMRFGKLYGFIDGRVIGNLVEEEQLVKSNAQKVSDERIGIF